MRTLITGASGFIGSHVRARLPDATALTRAEADLLLPLPHLPPAEAVIHCAAELDDPGRMRAVNVDGTARLVEWAERSGVQTFVHLSTGGTAAAGPYGETKRAAEEIVRRSSLTTHVVRLFFVYGPGQRPARLVPRLVARIRRGQPVRIDPRGGPRLSLTYVDDAVEAVLARAGIRHSSVLEVGGPPVFLRDLACCIGRALGRQPDFEVQESLADDFVTSPEDVLAGTSLEAGIFATVRGSASPA